jgi:hypothetical protein
VNTQPQVSGPWVPSGNDGFEGLRTARSPSHPTLICRGGFVMQRKGTFGPCIPDQKATRLAESRGGRFV